jgi:AAA family ATP:ADP antiporter
MNRLFGVRPDERRTVWVGFTTLLTIVAAHTILETARDSLFLAALPAARLPWAYLGIAVLAYLAARLAARVLAGRSARRVLAVMLAAGAVGTGVLWDAVATSLPASLMALYIWTGVLASVIVSQFWIQLAAQMDVAQAKRAYALIAAGGMLGATVGSGLATAALAVIAPRDLLGLAAALFALSAFTPILTAEPAAAERPDPEGPPADPEDAPTLRRVWADPYLKRLLMLTVMGPIVVMGTDFVFKSIVSQEVPRAALAPFFARFNMAVNAAALTFQLLVAPRLMQNVAVVRNLCLLPGSLGLAAVGVSLAGSLPAALLLRGTDGVLRHSLHRAATEILFLPLSPATRGALRRLAEALGQRGGQVVGSLFILLALGLGATSRELAAAVAVLCGLWLFGYVRLVDHYLERFRNRIGMLNAAPDADIPELDLQSLEALVATLSAPKDAEVLAAMDLLETYGRARLVTPLILYHPSPTVVLRGLALFEGTTRPDVQEIRRRLLQHGEPAVRAAALRTLAAQGEERDLVRRALRTDASPVVRRTALALWLGSGDSSPGELREAVSDLTAQADLTSRLAVASTLGELPDGIVVPVARALLDGANPAVRRAIARSLATDPGVARTSVLTELLAHPECRPFARAGLRALGDTALEHLARTLEDEDAPFAVRLHVPRSISAFGSGRAAEILVARIPREQDGRVLYKILRGLGRLRADDSSIPVDGALLMTVAEDTLARMIAHLAYRVAWDALRESVERRAPADAENPCEPDLLGALLVEKEERALERVCRILQILDTGEDFATIHCALTADAAESRASARELIGHVLTGGCRDALLALTDTLPPAERLEAAAGALDSPLARRTLEARRAAITPSEGTDATALLREIVGELGRDRNAVLASVARLETRRYDPTTEVTRAAG